MDCMTPSPPGTMCLARTTPPGNYTVPVKVCDQGNLCSESLISVLAEKLKMPPCHFHFLWGDWFINISKILYEKRFLFKN